MTPTNHPEDIWTIINGLRREIRELRAKVGLSSARISDGTLTIDGGEFVVQHQDGQLLLAVQRQDDGRYTIILRRGDGSKVLELGNVANSTAQFWALYDRIGKIVVSDDAVTGWGLADPKIVHALYPSYNKALVGTTSPTYDLLWEGEIIPGNPLLRTAWVTTITGAAGTTGQVRVLYDNVQVGEGDPITDAATVQTITADATTAGARPYGATMNVKLEGKRTAGTGTVTVTPLGVYGEQSP